LTVFCFCFFFFLFFFCFFCWCLLCGGFWVFGWFPLGCFFLFVGRTPQVFPPRPRRHRSDLAFPRKVVRYFFPDHFYRPVPAAPPPTKIAIFPAPKEENFPFRSCKNGAAIFRFRCIRLCTIVNFFSRPVLHIYSSFLPSRFLLTIDTLPPALHPRIQLRLK